MFQAGIIAGGRFFQAVGQALTVRISTDLMTPAQIGGVAQLGSIGAFFFLIAVAPVYHYVTRGFLEWFKNGTLDGVFKRYITYLFIIAALATTITWSLEESLNLVNGFSPLWAAALVGIYLLTSSISGFGSTGFNLINRRFNFVIYSNIPVWFGLLISFVLFKYYKTPEWWCLGQYTGFLLACYSIRLLFKNIIPGDGRRTDQHENNLPFTVTSVFRFGWPQVFISFLGWIQLHSYRFILDKIQGAASVGLFSAGYSLGFALMMMYDTLFFQYYQPIYYGELSNQGQQGLARAWTNFARAYIPSLVVFGIFVASNSLYLSNIFLGEQFRVAAAELIIWAVFIEVIGAAGKMLSFLGIGKIDMRILIIPQAAGAILAPIGVFILGSYSPLRGTAIGLCVAALALFFLSIRNTKKTINVRWPVRRIAIAGFVSIPLIILPIIMQRIIPSPTLFSGCAIVFCGSVYMLIIQVLFLKSSGIPWPNNNLCI